MSVATEQKLGWTHEVHELSTGFSAIVYDEHGYMVADHLTEERARLIAAAPDILEALKECHRALMHYEWYANPASGWAAPDREFVRHMTDAAIAKAQGDGQ